MLQAIVFDFDGVIVDSEPLHYQAFVRTAESLGVTFSYDCYLQRYIGFDDRDAFRAIVTELCGRPEQAADADFIADLCRRKGRVFEQIVHEGIRCIPGSVELICEAASAMPIAIASGATRADIDLILGKLELSDLFRAIITADQVMYSKPHPETYALAADALAIDPPNCLAIEDTAAGIESARTAGLQTLGVTTTGSASVLHRAHRVVPTLAGLTVRQLHAWFD